MKNRRPTRFTRDIYFHICAMHTRYIRRAGTCIRAHERRRARTSAPAHRAKRMHVVHRTHSAASTDWRDGTLHPRHARRDTGCPPRSTADWPVRAVIGRL